MNVYFLLIVLARFSRCPSSRFDVMENLPTQRLSPTKVSLNKPALSLSPARRVVLREVSALLNASAAGNFAAPVKQPTESSLGKDKDNASERKGTTVTTESSSPQQSTSAATESAIYVDFSRQLVEEVLISPVCATPEHESVDQSFSEKHSLSDQSFDTASLDIHASVADEPSPKTETDSGATDFESADEQSVAQSVNSISDNQKSLNNSFGISSLVPKLESLSLGSPVVVQRDINANPFYKCFSDLDESTFSELSTQACCGSVASESPNQTANLQTLNQSVASESLDTTCTFVDEPSFSALNFLAAAACESAIKVGSEKDQQYTSDSELNATPTELETYAIEPISYAEASVSPAECEAVAEDPEISLHDPTQVPITAEIISPEVSITAEVPSSLEVQQIDTEVASLPEVQQIDTEVTSLPEVQQIDTEVTSLPEIQQIDTEVTSLPEVQQIDTEVTSLPEVQIVTEINTLSLSPENSTVAEKTSIEAPIAAEIPVSPEVQVTAEIITCEVASSPEVAIDAEVAVSPEVEIAAEVAVSPEVEIVAEVAVSPEVAIVAEIPFSPEVEIVNSEQEDQFVYSEPEEPHTFEVADELDVVASVLCETQVCTSEPAGTLINFALDLARSPLIVAENTIPELNTEATTFEPTLSPEAPVVGALNLNLPERLSDRSLVSEDRIELIPDPVSQAAVTEPVPTSEIHSVDSRRVLAPEVEPVTEQVSSPEIQAESEPIQVVAFESSEGKVTSEQSSHTEVFAAFTERLTSLKFLEDLGQELPLPESPLQRKSVENIKNNTEITDEVVVTEITAASEPLQEPAEISPKPASPEALISICPQEPIEKFSFQASEPFPILASPVVTYTQKEALAKSPNQELPFGPTTAPVLTQELKSETPIQQSECAQCEDTDSFVVVEKTEICAPPRLSELFDICHKQEQELAGNISLEDLFAADADLVCQEIHNASMRLSDDEEEMAEPKQMQQTSRAESSISPQSLPCQQEPNLNEVNHSEAGPETAAEEKFVSSDIFKDPNAFDFLSRLGGPAPAVSRLERESLYVKFDPLVGTRERKVYLSPCLETSRGDNTSIEESLERPTSVQPVEEAVGTPPANSVGMLISFGTPTPLKQPQKAADTPVSTKQGGGDAGGTPTLREVMFAQELMDRQAKVFEERLAQASEREKALLSQLEQAQTNETQTATAKASAEKQFRLVMKEYEDTISKMLAELEHKSKAWNVEKARLEAERKQAQDDLAGVELAFSDLHRKYERAKDAIVGLKSNEEALRKSNAEFQKSLEKSNNNYLKLKAHAETQLEKANLEINQLLAAKETEQMAQDAKMKRLKLQIKTVEETLAVVTNEKLELVSICDDLVAKLKMDSSKA